MKEGVEASLASIQDQSRNTTKWWRDYPEQTTEQNRERSLKTLYTQKNQLQHKLSTPALQNTRRSGWSDPQLTSWREDPSKKDPTTIKTQRHIESQHKPQPKTSKIRRVRRPHTESHWHSTIEVHTINPGSQKRSI